MKWYLALISAFTFTLLSACHFEKAETPSELGSEVLPISQSIELEVQVLQDESESILISNGIPFSKGVLFSINEISLFDGQDEIPIYSHPLAYWPDQSIRSILLQFERPVASLPARVNLKIGSPRSKNDREPVSIPKIPQGVAFPSSSYLAGTRAFGPLTPAGSDALFANPNERELVNKYDERQKVGYQRLKSSAIWGNDVRFDGYYSTSLNWYHHFIRSGDLGQKSS